MKEIEADHNNMHPLNIYQIIPMRQYTIPKIGVEQYCTLFFDVIFTVINIKFNPTTLKIIKLLLSMQFHRIKKN